MHDIICKHLAFKLRVGKIKLRTKNYEDRKAETSLFKCEEALKLNSDFHLSQTPQKSKAIIARMHSLCI